MTNPDVDALRAEVLALWNANDAHEAIRTWMKLCTPSGQSYYAFGFSLVNGQEVEIPLPTALSEELELWQAALDTLRRATNDMESRRNSAREEHHG